MKKLFIDVTNNNKKIQEKAFYNAHKIVMLMNKEKLPPILMESFLKVLRNYKGIYNSSINEKALILLVDCIQLRLKPLYIDTFQLSIKEEK